MRKIGCAIFRFLFCVVLVVATLLHSIVVYRLLSVVDVSPQIYRNYRFPWGHNSFDTKFMFPDENPRVKCAKQFFLLSNLQI